MNNLKKIGLTALGTAMVATSAQAASLSVSGATSIFFGGEDNSNSGNGWSMTDQIDFNASGEMDNGMSLSLYMQLDNSGADFDDRKVTIGMDGHSLVFSGHGSSGPVGAWDDLTPSANEESWGTSIGGSVDGATNAAIGDNSFIYDYTVSDGIALKAAYKPSKGTALQSSTEIGIAYTGMEGLTVKAAMGENNTAADQIDLSVLSINYAMGPISVGYQTNEVDSTGSNGDKDFTAAGISYAVSDDLSVSFNVSEVDFEGGTNNQEATGISFSYTQGGMTLSGSHHSVDNVGGTATADNTGYELNLSFAF